MYMCTVSLKDMLLSYRYFIVFFHLFLSFSIPSSLSLFISPSVPPVIINHPESSITRIAGEDAIFNCSSSGYPLPNISWLYNSNELTSTHTIVETVDNSTMPPIVNSQLTVTFVNLTDAGEYQCRAVNYLVRFLNDSSTSSILSLECKSDMLQQCVYVCASHHNASTFIYSNIPTFPITSHLSIFPVISHIFSH